METISLFWSLPFVLLLGCIALMPFIHKHWWEKNYPKVAFGLATVAAAYYLLVRKEPARWLLAMEDYVSFIILLSSLYIVSGGILIRVARKATPLANSVLLLFGAVAANIFGTTGASMLLIRPFLRMNKGHIKPYHVVFFIFLVSNVGGALTPVGDPPLFLGYLSGVPFWWVASQCRAAWLTAVGVLLAIFFVIDTLDHGKQERHHQEDDSGPAVGFFGIHNFLFIAVIIAAVFQDGIFDVVHRIHADGFSAKLLGQLLVCREVLMLAAAAGSTLLTGKHIYEKNEFSYGPIKEVAILFIGIFSTMAPALQWLDVNANSLPVKTPGHFYFASGALSSVLDNAPTYKAFLELKLGSLKDSNPDHLTLATAELKRISLLKHEPKVDPALPVEVRQAVDAVVFYHHDDVFGDGVNSDKVRVGFLLGEAKLNLFLMAISLGSVFFGACTYIGNGPNFMVKSIAESAGAKTPSFVAYIVYYTLPILLPTYILVWAIFLRG